MRMLLALITCLGVGVAACGPSGVSTGDGGSTTCSPGKTESCYDGQPGTQGVAACKAGTHTCDATGNWGPCNDEIVPHQELCGDGVDNNCASGITDEAGTAAYEDNTGAFTDISAALLAGTASRPVVVGDQSSYDYVVTSGTIHLCEGDWYAKFVTASASTVLTISGAGADLTSVSSGGTTTGTAGSIFASSNAQMVVEDLTITGGVGSSSSKGGGVIASQTTGSAPPSVPNMTLRGVVVSGNATQYGGGAAINSYGWLSLEDSLIVDNTASVAGGGVWVQGGGKVTCTASALGAAGLIGNTAPAGGGFYFSSATSGALTTTGCDWGADTSGDDNATYDVQVTTTANRYCYGNATALTQVVSCASGSCTASTDSTCP